MWRRPTGASSSFGSGSNPPQQDSSHHHHSPFGTNSPRHRALLHQQSSVVEGPGLRRAKSNHSFTSLGSAGSGSLSNRPVWYQEDFADPDDTEGGGLAAAGAAATAAAPGTGPSDEGRRPRSNSHHSGLSLGRSPSFGGTGSGGGGGSSGGTTPRGVSNTSLSGMLAASMRLGSSGGGPSSARACLSSSISARRWAVLLTPQTDLWREREFGGLQVSPQDDREYRLLRLPNRLRAIVVSDPRTEKAAAALSVKVGAAQDPRPTPGLAHFCEHMLFLGTVVLIRMGFGWGVVKVLTAFNHPNQSTDEDDDDLPTACARASSN